MPLQLIDDAKLRERNVTERLQLDTCVRVRMGVKAYSMFGAPFMPTWQRLSLGLISQECHL